MESNDILLKAVQAKLIAFDEGQKHITYLHQGKKRNFTNPKEQVQAETYAQLILEYDYPREHIRVYEDVTMGSTTKEADLIIYTDAGCKTPYIVVECKKEDVSDAEFKQATEQAFSYASALHGTKFIVVTSKVKNAYFEFLPKSPLERIKNVIADIPKFGKNFIPPYKYVKKPSDNKFKDIVKVTESDLTRRFKLAHDTLWNGGELNPSVAFDELDKLIFCKNWDERTTEKNKPYQFQIFKDEAPEQLKKRILELYDKGKAKDPEVFNKEIDLTPAKLQTVVGYLQDINLSDTDLDSKGKAFETFLGTYFRGEFGQFFTPRNVVQMVVNVFDIQNTDRVLDTSCGSGGFLLYALDKVRSLAN